MPKKQNKGKNESFNQRRSENLIKTKGYKEPKEPYKAYGKNIVREGWNNRDFILILCFGFLVRIILGSYISGYGVDIGCFKSWSILAFDNFFNFYTSGQFVDYPPLYLYVMFFLGAVQHFFQLDYHGTAFTLLIKIPSFLCDLATAYLIYRYSIKHLNYFWATLITLFYIFNPAVLINSAMWGQVDSVFTLIVLLALIALSEDKPIRAAVLFSLSILMKTQGIIFLPILFFELLRQKNVRIFFKSLLASFCTVALVILPFSFNQSPLWLIALYEKAAKGYEYASLNAYSLFALLGANGMNDSKTLFLFSYNTWGLIFIIFSTLFVSFLYLRGKTSKIHFLTSLLLFSATIILSSRMHERYLYSAIVLSLFAFILTRNKYMIIFSILSSISLSVNTWEVLRRDLSGQNPWIPADDTLMKIFSLVNVSILILLFIEEFNLIVRNKNAKLNWLEKRS